MGKIKFRTPQEFIDDCSHVHSGYYDYSLCHFTSQSKPVIIICPVHGEFKQRAQLHLKGSGCRLCSNSKLSSKNSSSTAKFIERAKLKHGSKFDYSLIEYRNTSTKVKVTCIKHNLTFGILPLAHLKGKGGCKECHIESIKNRSVNYRKKRELETVNIIQKFREVHGDFYDYSEVRFIGWGGFVTIICPIHGKFKQRAADHYHKKAKCRECGYLERDVGRSNTEEFTQKAIELRGNHYDYSEVEYIDAVTKVKVKCNKHNAWYRVRPSTHLYSHYNGGCLECKRDILRARQSYSEEEFIDKVKNIHQDTYDLSSTQYSNSKTPVTLICKEHGEFNINPSALLSGRGCQKCGIYRGQVSNGEKELIEYVKELYPNVSERNRNILPSGAELDLYIPDKKVALEYNGLFWHSNGVFKLRGSELSPKETVNLTRLIHFNKSKECKDSNIRLIHIWEDDWLYNREVVKRYIRYLLGIGDRVYARNTKFVGISNLEAKEFYKQTHIQGCKLSYKHNYGLTFNGDLVAAISFDYWRSNRGSRDPNILELTRMASKYRIIGGASKLFSNAIKLIPFHRMYTYCDNSFFSGGVYHKLGFCPDKEVAPDYKVLWNKVRRHKSFTRRSNLEKVFRERFDPDLTELENCYNLNIFRVYDCGKTRYRFDNT